MFQKCFKFLAIPKDLIAAWCTRKIIEDPKDDNKAAKKYLMFLASFVMEDLGQVLCQESVEIIFFV